LDFTSDRERRLWLWTLVVVVAIFSTLGLARTLAGVLRENSLLGWAFGLGMLLVGAAVFTQRVKTRPSWSELGVWLGVAAAYLMVAVRMANPAERTQLIEYGVVAVLIHEALSERRRHGRPVPAPTLLAFGATALLGLLDECVQALLPSRVFDLRDIVFNPLAAFMAVAGKASLEGARRRWGRPGSVG
jgi:hypothetical protein